MASETKHDSSAVGAAPLPINEPRGTGSAGSDEDDTQQPRHQSAFLAAAAMLDPLSSTDEADVRAGIDGLWAMLQVCRIDEVSCRRQDWRGGPMMLQQRGLVCTHRLTGAV